MADSNRFRDLVECVERTLGYVDDFDRRIIDYWYVCGRQTMRHAAGIDRGLTLREWSAHISHLWSSYRSCYEKLRSAYSDGTLSAEEVDIYIEVARLVREVAELTRATQSEKVSKAELADANIVDLLDIFYRWGNSRRLQAYLYTNSGAITLMELDEKLDRIVSAIRECLG